MHLLLFFTNNAVKQAPHDSRSETCVDLLDQSINASWCDMNMHHIRRRRRRGNNTTLGSEVKRETKNVDASLRSNSLLIHFKRDHNKTSTY